MEQVIINSVQNACDALSSNEQEIKIVVQKKNDLVSIEVYDQGEGIDAENLNKIIDPFYTTKREKGGTGLGLSVSLGIIKEHGGHLTFKSEIGVGTCAKVELPIHSEVFNGK